MDRESAAIVRVAIVDDQALSREGLRRLLAEFEGCQPVAEFSTTDELLEAAGSELRADVVTINASLLGGVLEVVRKLQTEAPKLKVLVLNMHPQVDYALRALEIGAHGYLAKTCTPELLQQAIATVAGGRDFCDPDLIDPTDEQGLMSSLSLREFQVFGLLVAGEPGKAIAHQLNISPKTVSTYRSRILTKLGIGSNAELIRLAVELRSGDV